MKTPMPYLVELTYGGHVGSSAPPRLAFANAVGLSTYPRAPRIPRTYELPVSVSVVGLAPLTPSALLLPNLLYLFPLPGRRDYRV
jgi:hypothetical protein